jgi:arsenate reductase (thioredoxin)
LALSSRRLIVISVLFVCVHNSARSQMAEEYLRAMGGGLFLAESAGIEPGSLNPAVVKALGEDGIDIAGKRTQGVFDLYTAGRRYQYVIAVCSKDAADRCPIFPGTHTRLHWPFPDPAGFTGSEADVMGRVREVRDLIKNRVREFVEEIRTNQ